MNIPQLNLSRSGGGMLPLPTAVVVGGLDCASRMLAMTGLFGVLSHVVARRAREFGLRSALGANRAK
jgi:hypothetical protein